MEEKDSFDWAPTPNDGYNLWYVSSLFTLFMCPTSHISFHPRHLRQYLQVSSLMFLRIIDLEVKKLFSSYGNYNASLLPKPKILSVTMIQFLLSRSNFGYICSSLLLLGKNYILSQFALLISKDGKQSFHKKSIHVLPWRRAESVISKWLTVSGFRISSASLHLQCVTI